VPACIVATAVAFGASVVASHPLHSAVAASIHLLASSAATSNGGGGPPTP
jgi:hypothetical protein